MLSGFLVYSLRARGRGARNRHRGECLSPAGGRHPAAGRSHQDAGVGHHHRLWRLGWPRRPDRSYNRRTWFALRWSGASPGEQERRLLLLAGMAAGLSAIFRSPLGTGGIFAIEVLYGKMEFEVGALLYTMLSSAVAYAVSGLFVGFQPLFRDFPAIPTPRLSDYIYYIGLGYGSRHRRHASAGSVLPGQGPVSIYAGSPVDKAGDRRLGGRSGCPCAAAGSGRWLWLDELR